MNPLVVTASMSSPLGDGVPAEIVYIPEGTSQITPLVNGKAQTITVKVPPERGVEIAAKLQSDLVKRQASNVRPWIDFEHKAGTASALPQSFRYEPGKGIMCAVEWTGAGRTAIEGKDFSYFSPTFLLGDDGSPCGLPERGPLGGVLNEPAFREIPRIAASDAALLTEPNEPTAMSKLIFAALAISAAHADAETLAVQAIDGLKSDAQTNKKRIAELECELADLKKTNDKMKADCADAAKQRAEDLVKAAVADGRIAPKDEDKQNKFLAKIEAGDTFAEEILAQMPKLTTGADLTKPVITAGAAKVENATGFERGGRS